MNTINVHVVVVVLNFDKYNFSSSKLFALQNYAIYNLCTEKKIFFSENLYMIKKLQGKHIIYCKNISMHITKLIFKGVLILLT